MMDAIKAEFGERLRVAMAKARKNGADVSRACGVTRQAVQKWIDGSCLPASGHLFTLSQMLEVSVEWLMHHGAEEITVSAIPTEAQIDAGATALVGYYSDEIRRAEPKRWQEARRIAETVYRYMTTDHQVE